MTFYLGSAREKDDDDDDETRKYEDEKVKRNETFMMG